MADYQAFCCLYEIFTNHLIFHPPLNKNSTPATTLYHRNAIFFFHHVTAPNHKNWYKSGIKILSQTPETLDFPEFFSEKQLAAVAHAQTLPTEERTHLCLPLFFICFGRCFLSSFFSGRLGFCFLYSLLFRHILYIKKNLTINSILNRHLNLHVIKMCSGCNYSSV